MKHRDASQTPEGLVPAEARPWQAADVDPLDRRRRELFRLAAPVFRDQGYRGATIKALAYAFHRCESAMADAEIRGIRLHYQERGAATARPS